KTANTSPGWQVYATTTGIVNISSDTSRFVVVNTTTTDHILLVLPGQTAAPGTSRGFTGSALPATAGVPYISTVTITDRYYNTVSSVTPQIQMIANDPYAVQGGTLTINGPTAFPLMTFYKAPGPWRITVSTINGEVLVSTTSDPITVQAAPPTHLQVLMP